MPYLTVETKYGSDQVQARRLFGSRVLVVEEACVVQAGRKMRSGETLRQDAEIPEGAVLTPLRDPDNPGRVLHQIHRFGIYEALRGRRHTQETETEDLLDVKLSAKAARAIIMSLLQYADLTPAERVGLKRRLATLVVKHEAARNPAKAEAHDLLEASVEVTDSRGRLNPGATSARVAAAERRFEVRLSEIRAITPRVSLTEVVLINELERIGQVFTALCVKPALTACAQLEEGRRSPSEAIAIGAALKHGEHHLRTVDAAPFHVFRDRVGAELICAVAALRAKRFGEARGELRKVASALAWKEFQRALERVIYRVSTWLARDTFTLTRQENAVRTITQLLGKLEQIDEQPLRARKRRVVQRYLIKALTALRHRKPQEAKRALKSASHRL